MDKILISIVIPVYNEQNTLNKCLKTLLKQSLPAKEIIVIDDGSTDKTLDRVKHLQVKHKKIKLFTQKHLGPAIARNTGVKQAKGNVLVFVDADMEFEEYFLENLTAPIVAKKVTGTWSGNEWVKNWDNVWARCWNYNLNRPDSRMIADHSGQKKVYRSILKSAFTKVGGYTPTGYTDDWTLVKKIGKEPYVTQAKFYHHNPSTIVEIFSQSRWIGKRDYKFGMIGALASIIRANAANSLSIGFIKAYKNHTPEFIIFKLVYDLGITLGAIESLFGKKY